jgi:hypothetical protein
MCFVLFGNGIENLVVLPLIGAVSGLVIGTAAAWWRR